MQHIQHSYLENDAVCGRLSVLCGIAGDHGQACPFGTTKATASAESEAVGLAILNNEKAIWTAILFFMDSCFFCPINNSKF